MKEDWFHGLLVSPDTLPYSKNVICFSSKDFVFTVHYIVLRSGFVA